MQRLGFTVRGDADEPAFSLRAQPLEGRHDLVEHRIGAETRALCRLDDRVVKLEQIDALELQPLQAGLERSGDRLADTARLGRRQAHLRADIDIGLQRLQDAAEIALALAVAVFCAVSK